MDRLIVDQNGGVMIPAALLQKYGLHPGDQLSLCETEDGWRIYRHSNSSEQPAWWSDWWNGLTEEERQQARAEAREYWSLSEAERDAIWDTYDESLEILGEDDEDDQEEDEIDIITAKHSAGERAA